MTGVRATLVDKDKKYNWKPAKLEDVKDDMIEKFFTKQKDQDIQF